MASETAQEQEESLATRSAYSFELVARNRADEQRIKTEDEPRTDKFNQHELILSLATNS